MIACVIDVQARFRGYMLRRDNYKIVNRLKMRSVSRGKRFAKRRSEAATAHGGGEGENDQNDQNGAEPWVDPETGEVWQTLQDDAGNWYYLNQSTGESRWA